MKNLVIALLLGVCLIGCQSTPVTFAPYAGYGGNSGDAHGDGSPNQWHAGIGFSFTLGGNGGYVTPVPSHPGFASNVRVNNSNTNSNSNSTNATQTQTQTQTQNDLCGKCKNPHWPHCQ